MASNSALRSSFAAGFPLFAGPMYDRLGAPGATALLAGLLALMIPLPYVPRFVHHFLFFNDYETLVASSSLELEIDCELNLSLLWHDGWPHTANLCTIDGTENRAYQRDSLSAPRLRFISVVYCTGLTRIVSRYHAQ